MIVPDASAVVEILSGGPREREVAAGLAGARFLVVPEHFPVEAAAGVRRAEQRGGLSAQQARRAVGHLAAARIVRRPVLPMLDLMWELRDRLTVHDAAYVVLARTSRLPLVTLDAGQARVARELGVSVICPS